MIWWCFLGLAVAGVQAKPAFYNERQTGAINAYANLTDVNFIIVPTKELTSSLLLGPWWRSVTDRLVRVRFFFLNSKK